MSKILNLHAIEILDSRGTPTLAVEVKTENFSGLAKVPSGASTGSNEALEMRDNDEKRYFGKGVLKAKEIVNTKLKDLLLNKSVFEQEEIDNLMILEDGTENKSRFGANAILGVSMAISIAAAKEKKMPLYLYINSIFKEDFKYLLPCPMMNILNGGAHSDSSLDIQEFMIRPKGAVTFSEAIRMGVETFQTLKKLLKEKKYSTSVGDEGGFAPMISNTDEALDFIILAIKKAGYALGKDITIALDVAASEFYEDNFYIEKKNKSAQKSFKKRSSLEMIDFYKNLIKKYPIDTIEDPLAENDYNGWEKLTKELKNIQVVGDDLFVTNPKFLKMGIDKKLANAILIKLNQIGTVTETLNTIRLAQKNNFKVVVSHRSGETEDTYIADLAVATNAGQIKTGSLSRSDRIAKYNRLLKIEDDLGKKAHFCNFK